VGKLSDRQIELLTKIYENVATKADIREYLCLVVTDNVIGMEKVPKIVFRPASKMESTYAMMTEKSLVFSSIVVDDIYKEPKFFAEVLSTIGHELRHYNQEHVNLDDIVDKKVKQYYLSIKNEMENYQEAYGEDLQNWRILSSPKSLIVLNELFKSYPQESFANFYLNLSHTERKYLGEDIEQARYLANLHETDARYAGVLFQALVLERYLSDERVRNNEKLHSWIEETKQENLKLSVRDYDENMEDVDYYNQFEQASQNISLEFLNGVAQRIINSKEKQEQETYEAILSVCVKQYIKSVKKESLETLFKWAIQNMNAQETSGSPKAERLLACNFAKWIYFDTRNDEKEKTQFAKMLFDVAIAHASVEKQLMQSEREIHKFDNLDAFLIHVFSWEKFDWNKKIFEALAKNQRFEELCDFFDYKKLYLAEVDMAGTLPKTYLNHINSLLAGKCDILSTISSNFVDQKFTHNAEARRLKWYLSALEKSETELEYFYCKQESKRPPKTKSQIKAFHDYILDKTEFDTNRLDKAKMDVCQKMVVHPARFVENEKV